MRENLPMASPVNPPRGMRDFLPAEKARRERVLAVIRSTFTGRGFDEIETPVMEDSDRLHAGLGGDNEKLAFGVLKRGLTVDTIRQANDALDLADLGLRFDLTVPLARFYASHRGELPTVFRAIQIAPVWRAERPQKGRHRQFVQCDIDIIGEPGTTAEVELITATVATLDALGLEGCSIRINDRRLLTSSLEVWGVPREDHDSLLVTLDKLDKLGIAGVVTELHDNGFGYAVPAIEAHLRALLIDGDGIESPSVAVPATLGSMLLALPEGVDETVVAELLSIAAAVNAIIGRDVVGFDPWLVRGMGYYTGAIFEVAHPSVGYSIGGGGRYDGMIGRFLGTDVPAAGFSLGFERLVDLVTLDDAAEREAVVLLHDRDADPVRLLTLQAELVAANKRVRLERRPKNVKPLLDQLEASGFSSYASVTAEGELGEWKTFGSQRV
jgi:histidyl-tRNA synthetase